MSKPTKLKQKKIDLIKEAAEHDELVSIKAQYFAKRALEEEEKRLTKTDLDPYQENAYAKTELNFWSLCLRSEELSARLMENKPDPETTELLIKLMGLGSRDLRKLGGSKDK